MLMLNFHFPRQGILVIVGIPQVILEGKLNKKIFPRIQRATDV